MDNFTKQREHDSPMATRWLPTPTTLRLAIVPVLAFLATVTDRNYLADFWHHLARGEAMLQQGTILNHDTVTFTVPDTAFLDVNWLTQIGYALLFRAGGLALVQVVNAALVALALGWLVILCRRGCGADLPAVLAGIVAFIGVWEVLTIRPQTLSLVLFVAVSDLLERARNRPPWLLLVPILIGLWANVHGAFPAGIILVGCHFAADLLQNWRGVRARWLGICLAACLAMTVLNPYGIDIYRYVGGTSSIAYRRQIAEWVAPSPDRLIGIAWFASVALVVGLGVWRWLARRQLPSLADLLAMAAFLVMAAGSVRMVAWWMLVSAAPLAQLLAWRFPALTADDPEAHQPSWIVTAVAGLMALAVAFSLPGLDQLNPLLGPTRRGPRIEDDLESLKQYLLKNARPGNLYSHFEWGEYLGWSAAPRHRIFMDGRIEIYPDDVWDKYSTVTRAERGWNEVLKSYEVQYLILDADLHGRSGLLAAVRNSTEWEQAAESRSAILFVRKRNK